MKSKKLLRLTIMDAVELVLIQHGIHSSSKKIKKAVIRASEKISDSVERDLKKQHRIKRAEKFRNKLSPFFKQSQEEAVA